MCHSEIRHKYQIKLSRAGCKIKSSHTNLFSTIILPRLLSATNNQKIHFSSFESVARAHELDHYRIAFNHAKAMDVYIMSLPLFPTCALLTEKFNYGIKKISDAHKIAQDNYDRETQHGILQGSVINDTQ